MKFKKSFWLVSLSVFALLAVGCACKTAGVSAPGFTPKKFEDVVYTKKTDNFLLILDASSSMGECFEGATKFSMAKDAAAALNQTIPADLEIAAGFRTFGHSPKLTKALTEMRYGMTDYNQEDLGKAIDVVTPPGGTTPMAMALEAAGGDLEEADGKIAVVVISDGEDQDETPVTAAKALKEKFGERLCIYTIFVGDDAAGRKIMQQVADVGGCGFFQDAADLIGAEAMGDFVKKVFLTTAAPADMTDTSGDADGDGVLDADDKCPDTPAGAKVNQDGCWVLGTTLFDFDKSVIKPEFYPILDEVADVLLKNSDLVIQLKGHTDSFGTQAYNLGLSQRRADAVMDYLVKKGVRPENVSTKALGESEPVAPNDTPDNRYKNRRVEIVPQAQI